MITGLSHVSLVVPDLDAAVARLKEVYGLEAQPPRVNEQQGVRLAYVVLPNAKIELMEPLRADSPVARFLERNPRGGIHHLCLEVDDLEATADCAAARGVRVLGDGRPQLNVDGRRIAFVHPADFLGALVELEQH
jgi:methylmalonyl-CoA/ethylmalonyl-CoA epimerase